MHFYAHCSQVYLAEDARLEMGLHREDLVALAYFLGSDYAEGVTGVGIVNAVEIVHAFPMHSRHSGNGQKPASSSCSSSSSAAVQVIKGAALLSAYSCLPVLMCVCWHSRQQLVVPTRHRWRDSGSSRTGCTASTCRASCSSIALLPS